LEKGVELIDSSGLNDTEARNNLTLGYLNNCQAILFVLSATQPFTQGERRYLENSIKDKGLATLTQIPRPRLLISPWLGGLSLISPIDCQPKLESISAALISLDD
jgi:Dynamin family